MKSLVFALAFVLAAPAAIAQQNSQQPTQHSKPVQSFQDLRARESQSRVKSMTRAQQQGYLDSLADLETLRGKLADAWTQMGMSPAGAKRVADAYDPDLAARSHHTSLRGKSDQEIARLMQDALKEKKYLKANQLLIDYQRQKLALSELSSPQTRGNSGL
ncbi:hypothetical protein [Frateuria soli]|uniref:hypothetical protein n=1 Tax=Frateuria soli TaxID=1542730 RepID=UPI001E3AD909|nr:hypothetical protein [Frateuria soli]UGB37668.1 hypothetical protein LQ771_12660 [Frateuria soli]